MADITVGILEPNVPTKYIDNEEIVNDQSETVARQKVATPDAATLLFEIMQYLQVIAANTAIPDPLTKRTRVIVEAGTLPVVTTVSTVSSVSNMVSIGGFNAALQQVSLTNIAANCLYSNIVIS